MFKKIIALVLAAAMLLSLVACAKTEAPAADAPAATDAPAAEAPAADEPAAEEPAEYVDPYADLAEDYDELSAAKNSYNRTMALVTQGLNKIVTYLSEQNSVLDPTLGVG